MQKRLHRSRTERMIAGVCGGIAEYLDIDPTIVRLIWVLISLLAGAGILLYLICWIIIPADLPTPPAGPPAQRY
jgi:phage shock protein C